MAGCVCTSHLNIDQDFLSDLGSENNRIAGTLYLDYFNNDLSKMTYDYYLTFITNNEALSAKGFSTIVKNADSHYFESTKDHFILALYYKNEKKIIYDNSSTAFYDSMVAYQNTDSIPSLDYFVSKIKKK